MALWKDVWNNTPNTSFNSMITKGAFSTIELKCKSLELDENGGANWFLYKSEKYIFS